MKGQKQKIARETGLAIRAHRVALRISQEAFADQIGMHRAYYSAIERGEKNITLATLHRVAEGLGTTMSALLKDVEP